MKYEIFNVKENGFAGHLFEPEVRDETAVIVVMGGEQSIMPGRNVAERFAEYGFMAVSVSLFGADDLPKGPDRIPLDMIGSVAAYLKTGKKAKKIAIYGMSMGSLFAAMASKYIPGIDTVIMVSPSHTIFEGTIDKKHMSGHSFMTWKQAEFPFVPLDLAHKKMRQAFDDAYSDKKSEAAAAIPIETLHARILLIGSDSDESWPAAYSVNYLNKRLEQAGYPCPFKAIIYHNASHMLGILPDKTTHPWIYRLAPLAFSSLRRHKRESMDALAQSETEIIQWLNPSAPPEGHHNLP